MMNIQHLFQQDGTFQLYDKTQDLQRFREEFMDKDYYDSYKEIFTAASLGSYLTNALSIATGFTFVFLIIFQALPQLSEIVLISFSGAIALAVLLFLEFMKRKLIRNYIKDYLKFKRIKPIPLAINLALIAVSVWFSVKGAEQFVLVTDNAQAQIQASTATKKDSIARYYSQAIAQAGQEAKDFFEKNSFQGKVTWTEDQSLNKHYKRLQERAVNLKEEHHQALAKLDAQAQAQTKISQDTTKATASFMVWFAAGNELACLALIIYTFYFKFRAVVQAQVQAEEEEEETPTNNEVADEENRIGYRTSASTVNSNVVVGQPTRNQAYLKKYQHVIPDLSAGLTKQQLAQKHGISITTVDNIKRVYRNTMY